MPPLFTDAIDDAAPSYENETSVDCLFLITTRQKQQQKYIQQKKNSIKKVCVVSEPPVGPYTLITCPNPHCASEHVLY